MGLQLIFAPGLQEVVNEHLETFVIKVKLRLEKLDLLYAERNSVVKFPVLYGNAIADCC